MGARPLRPYHSDHIEDAVLAFITNPSEKELKAIMTSNGKILVSQQKTESTESVNSSQEEKWISTKWRQKTVSFLLYF